MTLHVDKGLASMSQYSVIYHLLRIVHWHCSHCNAATWERVGGELSWLSGVGSPQHGLLNPSCWQQIFPTRNDVL